MKNLFGKSFHCESVKVVSRDKYFSDFSDVDVRISQDGSTVVVKDEESYFLFRASRAKFDGVSNIREFED